MLKALPLLAVLAAAPAFAQQSAIQTSTTPPAVTNAPGDEWKHDDLVALGHDLLKHAEASSGSYSVYLTKYNDHFTMLAARTKSGGGEYHGKWADIFVCVEGEATVLTGGTLENSKDKDNGEKAGTRVVGGTEHVMRPGDVVHIAAATPHQTVVAPGQHVVYYVVKVAQ